MICTSIEQSQQLIELGIDINTADMSWLSWMKDGKPRIGFSGELFNNLYDISDFRHEYMPAWSLSALLGLIKSEIYGENIYGDTITYKVKFRKYKFTDDVDLYQIAYGSIKFDADGQHSFKDMVNTGEKDNLVDAAFEMVVWLKENKKI